MTPTHTVAPSRQLRPSTYDNPWDEALRWASRTLVVIGILAQFWAEFRFWNLTWDDSAITLGFARTFAATGRIEPTPGSGIVEGYSTTLWMLLMSLAAKLFSSPATLLAVAKISTLSLNVVNILLIRYWFSTWSSELVANLTAGSVGCVLMFYETINGMESPILLTLVLVMVVLFPRQGMRSRLTYVCAGIALLLVRWEAAWLLLPFLIVERPWRRRLSSAAIWAAAFAASNIVRWRYFGHILPNTVIAKRGVPYSPPDRLVMLKQHLLEPALIVASCKIFLLLLVISWLLKRATATSNRTETNPSYIAHWQFRFSLAFVICLLILSAAIGPNWGPEFRAFYPGWPFLFGLVLIPTLTTPQKSFVRWCAVLIFAVTIGRMAVRARELYTEPGPKYMPAATVGDIARINTRIAKLKAASGRDSILYAGPDMGAILLYSNGVRIVDLGLLCDPVLAVQRFKAMDSYVIRQRRPDVIEVHAIWTGLTALDRSAEFLKNYRPVYVDGTRFFVSLPMLESINRDSLQQKDFSASGRPDGNDLRQNDIKKADLELNRKFGRYFRLQ